MLKDMRYTGICLGWSAECDIEEPVGVLICHIEHYCSGLEVLELNNLSSEHIEVRDLLDLETIDHSSDCRKSGSILMLDLNDRLCEQ